MGTRLETSGCRPLAGDRAGGAALRAPGTLVDVRITVLAGGIGAARFLRGLLACAPEADVTVVGNTGDDLSLYGLRVSPDLDTVMYTLGGGNDEARGWGRAGETWHALSEIQAYDATPSWFGLGDLDIGTHLVRTALLADGHTLSEATAALTARWQLPVRLVPMTDDRVETHVLVEDPDTHDGRRRLHFQEYWVRHHAELPVVDVWVEGIEDSSPAPGVLDAIASADVLLLPPSNPVVSIGPILDVPGVRAAVAATPAPVVGLSPIVGGAPVRGMADKLLPAIGVDTSAAGVALHFGARSAGGLLDGWLVDVQDAQAVPRVEDAGIAARAVPLLMSDVAAAAAMARAALDLAEVVRR
jgi:LPPG:FO 2-phospho-L-lactate transferase